MPQLLPGNSLGFLLTDASRLARQESERCFSEANLQLTYGEIRTLAHAARYRGSRQAALAERMGIEPMTVSAFLDKLEMKGLVERQVDPSDRRAKIVVVTQQAAVIFDEIRPVVLAMYERMVAGIDDADLDTALDVLTRIRLNLTTDPALVNDDSTTR
ncbi:MarR family winged helix-turn-helix transcriptional regulator [Mangrovibrevibacter kandeliae]|uniref:MarR family winged helix-turn-helix transcriptional regulator n=1 Tax=Mangrovibrevibacter kandeliae TaxID=2968473 RepID=UPI0021175D1C|nr:MULTISPECIES: MarR family transcriptional regulator [unclassified Aurantimonas]MCQ8781348.1 MarR family transcriptional regulator [Aurantimonas sp. CSK15Z-1]MCW4114130.1 MarR family transcriptional regulator [Aurantimonas sp. MSK8Z-1]